MRAIVVVELALPMICLLALIRPSVQDNKVSGDSPCTGKPCSNGGECTEIGNSYMCRCQKGFGGKQCQEAHMCEFKPCDHGATCVETKESYRCLCAWGFSGPKCESQAGGPVVSLGLNATLLLLGVCSSSVVFVILLFTLFGALYNMKYAPLSEVDMEKGDAQQKSGYTSESGPESGPETGPESGAETGPESGAGTGPDTGPESGTETVGETGDTGHKHHGKGHKHHSKSKDKGDGNEKGHHGKDKGHHGKDKGHHGKDKSHSKDKGHAKGHGDKKAHKHK